jgi:hypothetical protein
MTAAVSGAWILAAVVAAILTNAQLLGLGDAVDSAMRCDHGVPSAAPTSGIGVKIPPGTPEAMVPLVAITSCSRDTSRRIDRTRA